MSDRPPTDLPQQIQVHVDWSAGPKLPAMGANVFFVQQTPHEFIISFGFASPPMVPGPMTLDQAKQIKIVAEPIVRLSMAPGRVVELVQLLNQQLAAYQQSQRH